MVLDPDSRTAKNKNGTDPIIPKAHMSGSARGLIRRNLRPPSAPRPTPRIPAATVIPPNIRPIL